MKQREDNIPTGDCLTVVLISKPAIDLHFANPTLVDAISEGKVGVDDFGNFPLRDPQVFDFVANIFNEQFVSYHGMSSCSSRGRSAPSASSFRSVAACSTHLAKSDSNPFSR